MMGARLSLTCWACCCLTIALLEFACAGRRIGIQVRLTGTDNNRLGIDRHQVAAAALMAGRHVNDRVSTIVPQEVVDQLPDGFQLSWEMRDTFSSPQIGVYDAVQWTGLEGEDERPVDLIIGAIRSAVSGPVALVAQVTQTPVLSYWSTSAALSDKSIYPNFARTVPPDSLNAFAMTNILAEMGWGAFSVLFLNDLYGVGYSQDLASAAGTLGLTVASAQKYTSGEPETIRTAMRSIKAAGVRIVICIAFSTDMDAILQAAKEVGIIGRGWVWVTGDAISDPNFILATASDPVDAAEQLNGWMQVQPAAFAGNNGPKFQNAWFAEPPSSFNHSLLRDWAASNGVVLQAEACPEICGFAYDAVWAAAIAVSRAATAEGLAGDAEAAVDRTEVLAQLKALDFEASTGTVSFDENGDRATDSIAVAMFNWVVGGDGLLEVRELGLWYGGRGLERSPGVEPVWGEAGVVGWDMIPTDGSTCEAGSVYSDETLQCEACRPGTAQRDLVCEACALGTHAPFSGMTQCVPCDQGTYANETGLAGCRRCPQNAEVPFGAPQVSEAECRCMSGFLFNCAWHVWQLLVLIFSVVLLALAACVAALYFQREVGTEEERRVTSKMRELRARLRLQQTDGVLLTGEGKSWVTMLCWWRIRHTSHHRLNPKCLESAARLALFLEFDAEAFDMLYIYATLLDTEKAEFGHTPKSRSLKVTKSLRRAMTVGRDVMLDSIFRGSKPTEVDREHSSALSQLLLDVARRLLDPSDNIESDAADVSISAISVTSFLADASPEDRFEFFVTRLARLRLWHDFDNFEKLKQIAQEYMDSLRHACDRLYEEVRLEPGGEELIHFATPGCNKVKAEGNKDARLHGAGVRRLSQHHVLLSPPSLRTAAPAATSKEEAAVNASLQYGRITRQDSDMVQAIRLDEEDWKEIEMQWEGRGGSSSSRSSMRSDNSQSRSASGASSPAEDLASLPAALTPESERDASVSVLRNRRRVSLASCRSDAEDADGVSNTGSRTGSVAPRHDGSRAGSISTVGRRRRPSSLAAQDVMSPALGVFQRMSSFSLGKTTGAKKRTKRDRLLDERMLDNALRSLVVRQKMCATSGRTLAVDEEVYIGHLHQRATLLNNGFQKRIRVAVGLRLLELQKQGAYEAPGDEDGVSRPLVPPLVVSGSKKLKPPKIQKSESSGQGITTWLREMMTSSSAGGPRGAGEHSQRSRDSESVGSSSTLVIATIGSAEPVSSPGSARPRRGVGSELQRRQSRYSSLGAQSQGALVSGSSKRGSGVSGEFNGATAARDPEDAVLAALGLGDGNGSGHGAWGGHRSGSGRGGRAGAAEEKQEKREEGSAVSEGGEEERWNWRGESRSMTQSLRGLSPEGSGSSFRALKAHGFRKGRTRSFNSPSSSLKALSLYTRAESSPAQRSADAADATDAANDATNAADAANDASNATNAADAADAAAESAGAVRQEAPAHAAEEHLSEQAAGAAGDGGGGEGSAHAASEPQPQPQPQPAGLARPSSERNPSPQRQRHLPRLSSAPSCASNGSPRSPKKGSASNLTAALEDKFVMAELALSACDAVQVHGAPIKTKARMREKVKCYQDEIGERSEDAPMLPLTACILDPVRSSIVCKGPRSILEHVEWFMKYGPDVGLPTVRVKNKFAIQDSTEYDGYRDLMLSVHYTGDKGLRIIGEIQLHDARMYALKVKMHKLYKVKRATTADQIQ